MRRSTAVALAALALAGCGGNPQELPVRVSHCRAVPAAKGFTVVANIENTAEKPISALEMAISFYTDFRYRKFAGSGSVQKELDPGDKREVTFSIGAPGNASLSGPAMGCFVTHVRYLDGTSQDAPPPP